MIDSETHDQLFDLSPGYREWFRAHQANYQGEAADHVAISFAGWTNAGGDPRRFASWTRSDWASAFEAWDLPRP